MQPVRSFDDRLACKVAISRRSEYKDEPSAKRGTHRLPRIPDTPTRAPRRHKLPDTSSTGSESKRRRQRERSAMSAPVKQALRASKTETGAKNDGVSAGQQEGRMATSE